MAVISINNTAHFDFGILSRLEKTLGELKVERPMLVTDKGLVAAGLAARAQAAAGARAFAAVYDETATNPDERSVKAAVAAYKAANCDGLVALGGGSPMDLAKAVAILVTHEGELEIFGVTQRGSRRIGKVAPLIAIPTTAGTGSEVSTGAIVILESGRKETFVSGNLLPPVALCDPELTLGLPKSLTAATGMDAVAHCIEAVLTPVVNPPLEAIGYDGLRRAVGEGWLVKAVEDGADRDARWQMMMASLEGAIAFGKGLGAVHSLSHATGRLEDLKLHHGTLNAIYLPGVLRFSEGSADEKYARLRDAMGLKPGADLSKAVNELNVRLGLPTRLGPMGLSEDHIEGIATYAETDLAHGSAPRKPAKADYEQLVREVL